MKPFFTISLFLFIACNSGSEKNTSIQSVPPVQEKDTPTTDWSGTDMLEFIHYPDPANQRVYRHVMIKDTSLVGAIIQNLQLQPTVDTKECVQNSKLYLFRKGDVYKTVYVSDSCNYLAYAINTNQHFVALSNRTRSKIDSLVRTLKD